MKGHSYTNGYELRDLCWDCDLQ